MYGNVSSRRAGRLSRTSVYRTARIVTVPEISLVAKIRFRGGRVGGNLGAALPLRRGPSHRLEGDGRGCRVGGRRQRRRGSGGQADGQVLVHSGEPMRPVVIEL
jgi:hypothetical protein